MNNVSFQNMTLLEQELEPGESLKWCEEPDPKRHAMKSLPNLFMGAIFAGFAAFWMCSAFGFKLPDFSDDRMGYFPLIGLIFFFAGVVIMLSPLWSFLKAKKSVYAVTNTRAIILEGLFTLSIRSFFAGELHDLERKQKANGSGDLIFKKEVIHSSSRNGQRTKLIGFIGIENVKQVENLLNEITKQD